ncbi:glycosyltransferase family 39 protein [Rhodopseudomonas sp. B29]|uniref:glycosyltransferase family 39 protein n=1 Tax=Rhodopseudomonas sp. B29 TaxID=95607 RepID=UPI00034CB15F|nr:glycosyltransferase family 39 protein [Rhodopseudomonas sp. B29]
MTSSLPDTELRLATPASSLSERTWTGHGLSRPAEIDRYDVASLALLATLGVLVLITFRDYGITNDEWVQQRYGELIVDYYRSGFTDRALFSFDNLYLYGGLFDVTATLLHKVSSLDLFDLRHLLSAACGVGGIFAAMATARLVAGPRAGLLAGLSLAVCGFWYGAMFHHTKDVPLGAAMAGALYFLIRAARDCPKPQLRHLAGFGILTGCALGIKVLALLLLCYLPVAILLNGPSLRPTREAVAFWTKSLIGFAPALLIAYAIMLAAWPWAALAPLNPIRGLLSFGEFHYAIRTMLAGHVYEMATVPRWYVPTYLTIKTPLFVLLGASLAIASLLLRREQVEATGSRRREIGLVMMAALFPVLCEVIAHGPAFTGMRHFMFVLPPLAMLAGIGLNGALRWASRIGVAAFAAAAMLIVAALGWNAVTLVRLHPYEYLYYNPLVGGLKGASRRYVTDYWFTIMPEAVQRLERYIARTDPADASGRVYTVALCGPRDTFLRHAPHNLRWAQVWQTADFFIAPTHMNCDQDIDAKVAVTIERLGVPIGYVKDQRAKTRVAAVR